MQKKHYPQASDLELRLGHLERNLAWQRMVFAATMIAVVAFGLVAFRQNPPKDVEARSFVLRNDEGKVVGYFGACATGSEFVLYGPDANTGIHVHGTDQGGQFQVFGLNDMENVELLGGKDGGRVTIRKADGEILHRFPAGTSE